MISADRRALLLGQWLFALAIIAAFVVACSPLAIKGGPEHNDKFAHMLAFYGLSLFGALAHPRMSLLWLGAGMSAYGAAIEVVQGLPFVGRDADLWDWIADTVATAAALGPLAMAGLRQRFSTVTPAPRLRV